MNFLKFLVKNTCQILKVVYNTPIKTASTDGLDRQLGDVAELVDALDLGSSAARCESSSLSVPTIFKTNNQTIIGFLCMPK